MSDVAPAIASRSAGALFSNKHPVGRALRLGGVFGLVGAALAMHVPLCPIALVTRHPCPGCGLTRATVAILHGDVATGLHLHPLAPIMTPLVAALLVINGLAYVRTGRFERVEGVRGKIFTAFLVVLGVAMIGVWIARFCGALGGPVPV